MRRKAIWTATRAQLRDGSWAWCVTKRPGGSTYWCLNASCLVILTGARQERASLTVADKLRPMLLLAVGRVVTDAVQLANAEMAASRRIEDGRGTLADYTLLEDAAERRAARRAAYSR